MLGRQMKMAMWKRPMAVSSVRSSQRFYPLRHFLFLLLVVGVALLLSPPADAASIASPYGQSEPGASAIPTEYQVQRGDTLSGIARRFNTTVSELLRLNLSTAERKVRKIAMEKVSGIANEMSTFSR